MEFILIFFGIITAVLILTGLGKSSSEKEKTLWKEAANRKKILDKKVQNSMRCPLCKTDDIHQIHQIMKADTLGIGPAGRRYKTYCSNCGHEWQVSHKGDVEPASHGCCVAFLVVGFSTLFFFI